MQRQNKTVNTNHHSRKGRRANLCNLNSSSINNQYDFECRKDLESRREIGLKNRCLNGRMLRIKKRFRGFLGLKAQSITTEKVKFQNYIHDLETELEKAKQLFNNFDVSKDQKDD